MFHSFLFWSVCVCSYSVKVTIQMVKTIACARWVMRSAHCIQQKKKKSEPIKNIKPLLQALQIKFIVHSTCVLESNKRNPNTQIPQNTVGHGACGESMHDWYYVCVWAYWFQAICLCRHLLAFCGHFSSKINDVSS